MKLVPALAASLLAGCFVQPANPNYNGGGGTYSSGGGGYAGDPNGGGGDPYAGDPSGGAAPSGPVYVEIRSSCPYTMNVFYGSDPQYGSGTHSSIETNSVSSHSFQPGEMFWITGESDKGIDGVTITPNTRTLEIDSSCSSIHEN